MSVTGIGTGIGAAIAVKPTIRPSSASLVAAARATRQSNQLTETQRKGMVKWLQASRALHARLEEAIEITARSVFGKREKTTPGEVETGDLGLGSATVASADLALDQVAAFSGVTADDIRINSTTISIDPTTDTLNGVITQIDAISSLSASLTASDELELVPTSQVRINDDSAGFFAAIGLGTGNYGNGVTVTSDPISLPDVLIDETTSSMDVVSAFSGVTSGTLTVMGTALSIDPTTDSFSDVVSLIDGVDGASASYDASAGTLTIAADDGDLTLDSDTSGFLSAVGLSTGTTEATTFTTSRRSNDRVFAMLVEAADLTNGLFRHHDGDAGTGSPLGSLRGGLERALLAPFDTDEDDGPQRDNSLGFHVDLSDLNADKVAPQNPWQMFSTEQRDLQRALLRNPDEVRDFLLGTDDEAGLLTGLRDAIEDAHKAVLRDVGSVGGLLTKFA